MKVRKKERRRGRGGGILRCNREQKGNRSYVLVFFRCEEFYFSRQREEAGRKENSRG